MKFLTSIHFNVKISIFLLFICLPVTILAQNQKQGEPPPPPPPPAPLTHLIPVDDIFSTYDFQFEYYARVRKILFDKLSGRPEIRFLVLPSFTPENVLDIEYNRKQDKYFLIYHICKEMIWYNKKWRRVKVIEYRKEIDSESVDLIKTLFMTAISKTRFNDMERPGLDGVDYYFSYFDMVMKSGTIWSGDCGTTMDKLVKIGNELIELAKSDDSTVHINDTLKKDILNLTGEL